MRNNSAADDSRRLSRRALLASGGALAGSAFAPPLLAAEAAGRPDSATNPNVTPLAQEYVVVARTPAIASHYMHDPGLARLPNGHLFVAAPARTRDLKNHKNFTYVSHSVDGGATWKELPTIPFCDATPFVYGEKLYLAGQYEQGADWYIRVSENEGTTWSEPVLLFRGNYWNCSTSMVIEKDRLYWALGTGKPLFYALVAVSCDLTRGLLDPAAWRLSNVVDPPMPGDCTRTTKNPQGDAWRGSNQRGLMCLEPNVVSVNGRLFALARNNIDSYSTAHLAAVCDITERDGALRLDFAHYSPLPGGQNKFFIVFDEATQLFFMLSNLVTDSHDLFQQGAKLKQQGFFGGPGNERRWLFLHYSLDAFNWFPAGCVARLGGMKQSFMYPSAAIDGADLIFISRTSLAGRNQHDADLCTFHRVRDFRRLAMDLKPSSP